MFLSWEREIWEGRDPISLWRELWKAFDGDPSLILELCQSQDPEAKAHGRARLTEKVRIVFWESPDPEADYLRFMDWVATLRAEYLAQVEAGLPFRGGSYRELCGFWFNRDLARYQNLWVVYRALYLSRHGLPLPPEAYNAITSSTAEAAEQQYDEVTDAIDRQITSRRGA